MRNTFILGLFLLLFCSCRLEVTQHNPVRALSETNSFLKALYIEEDYPTAFELSHAELRKGVTSDNLKQIVERTKQLGTLKRLKADSYMETPGRTMELFYVGMYERGTIYHRIVLMGDATSGYKVSGVWFKAEPYPQHASRQKFNEEIFVE
ncbi:MAG TPA: hypothetical protein VNO50_14895 [Pyrinomonadaceae bacterium]|nr:hypothetical protein [Pyrinomonadaceae bacterium]